MTRKDYILIAEALKAAQPLYSECLEDRAMMRMHILISRKLATELARDNPRFDRERFLKACGVQS